MKLTRRIFQIAAAACLTSLAPAISITTTNDAELLAAAIFGEEADGVDILSTSYSGADMASGTYTNLEFAPFATMTSGLLMTTGNAQLAIGPNEEDSAGVDNLGPNQTFTNYDGTNSAELINVAKLTIQFYTDQTQHLSFDFTFGSEEYYYYTNSPFNDAFFAFLDNNPTTLSLDSNNHPITINNQFLTIDNRPNDPVNFPYENGYGLPDLPGSGNPAGIDELQYDGFTPVLRTTFTASQGYHSLTFVIGDAGDGVLDSGVFISRGLGSGNDDDGTDLEPESASFLALALGFAGVWRHRKRVTR